MDKKILQNEYLQTKDEHLYLSPKEIVGELDGNNNVSLSFAIYNNNSQNKFITIKIKLGNRNYTCKELKIPPGKSKDFFIIGTDERDNYLQISTFLPEPETNRLIETVIYKQDIRIGSSPSQATQIPLPKTPIVPQLFGGKSITTIKNFYEGLEINAYKEYISQVSTYQKRVDEIVKMLNTISNILNSFKLKLYPKQKEGYKEMLEIIEEFGKFDKKIKMQLNLLSIKKPVMKKDIQGYESFVKTVLKNSNLEKGIDIEKKYQDYVEGKYKEYLKEFVTELNRQKEHIKNIPQIYDKFLNKDLIEFIERIKRDKEGELPSEVEQVIQKLITLTGIKLPVDKKIEVESKIQEIEGDKKMDSISSEKVKRIIEDMIMRAMEIEEMVAKMKYEFQTMQKMKGEFYEVFAETKDAKYQMEEINHRMHKFENEINEIMQRIKSRMAIIDRIEPTMEQDNLKTLKDFYEELEQKVYQTYINNIFPTSSKEPSSDKKIEVMSRISKLINTLVNSKKLEGDKEIVEIIKRFDERLKGKLELLHGKVAKPVFKKEIMGYEEYKKERVQKLIDSLLTEKDTSFLLDIDRSYREYVETQYKQYLMEFIKELKKQSSMFAQLDKTQHIVYEEFLRNDLIQRFIDPLDRIKIRDKDKLEEIDQVINKIFELTEIEEIPVEIGKTKADSKIHIIEGSKVGNYEDGVVIEIVSKGFRYKNDKSNVIRKPVVIRGEKG